MHTKEPWGLQWFGPYPAIVGLHSNRPIIIDTEVIRSMGISSLRLRSEFGVMRAIRKGDEDHPDLVRLFACVNAMAGIADPTHLRKQRDALLAACEALLPYVEDQVQRGTLPNGEDDSKYGDSRAVKSARDAIAMAKGGAA